MNNKRPPHHLSRAAAKSARWLFGFSIMMLLTSCNLPSGEPPTPTPNVIFITATPLPVGETYGPDNYPADVNPLTGLSAQDPTVLERRPILVKVSNESADVRPLSGLSYADHVWQHQMEDAAQGTRYTAVYYSQTPEYVGSVRSARLPDVDVFTPMYGGILAFSGGSSNLADPPGSPPRIRELVLQAEWAARALSEQTGASDPYLVRRPGIPEPNTPFYHSLFADPSAIWQWAEQNSFNQQPDLAGLRFGEQAPEGGTAITSATVDYPAYGPQHIWQADVGSGRWLHNIDGQPDRDFLTGQQLAFDNIIIIYDEHYLSNFLEDDNARLFSLGFRLQGEGRAIILRDGQSYEARWQREGDQMVRLLAEDNQDFVLSPGNIWFHVIATNDTYQETSVTFTE